MVAYFRLMVLGEDTPEQAGQTARCSPRLLKDTGVPIAMAEAGVEFFNKTTYEGRPEAARPSVPLVSRYVAGYFADHPRVPLASSTEPLGPNPFVNNKHLSPQQDSFPAEHISSVRVRLVDVSVETALKVWLCKRNIITKKRSHYDKWRNSTQAWAL